MSRRRNEPSAPPPVQNLFRKLELMEKEEDANGYTGHSRWMIPYADLLTLLLGLFLVLFTASGIKAKEAMAATASKTQQPAVASVAKSPENAQSAVKDSENLPINKMNEAKSETEREDMQLQSKLESALTMQGVEIRQQERGVVISLKDSILFAPGSADLSPEARKTLDQLSDQLTQAMGPTARPIRVEGHTDNAPITTARFPSNWELSTARATNIVRYLVSSRHFAPDKLSAAGYGEFKPVADNSSIEGKQKNRRVDIVVLNAGSAQQEPPSGATPQLQEAQEERNDGQTD